MTHEAGDLPSPDNVYRPTLGEALARFMNGTLGELAEPDLAGDGNQIVVFLGRPQPEADGTVYVDDQGQVVYPFARKFEHGSEGWQLGDVVRANLRTVDANEGGVSLRSDMADSRVDDIFTLSDEDQALVRGHGLASLDLDLEIVGPENGFIIPVYPARIRRINHIEELWDGEREVAQGEQVLAQGEVVEYVAPSWSRDHGEQSGSLTIRLASGQEVTSAVHDALYLGRGVIDVVIPGQPLTGEVIQVHLCPNDGGRSSFLRPPAPVTAPLQVRREGYLVKPDPERLADYTKRREAVAKTLAELATLEGAAFRQTAGALIRSQLDASYRPNTVFVTNFMSAKERTALLRLMAEKFPDAADGTPDPEGMYLSAKNQIGMEWFVAINDTLGVDALAMSRREYYQFCEELVTRARSSEPQTYVNVYPLTYLNRDFTEEQRLALLSKGCETWIAYTATLDPEAPLPKHEDKVFHWILSELSILSQTYPAALRYYREAVEPFIGERKNNYSFGPSN